jgi:glycosyltransferase involved in cell wall biosynthesis
MKIIHVITAFGLGGAEKLLLEIVNRQVLKNDVYLVYFKGTDLLLPYLNKQIYVKKIPLSVSTAGELRKYFKLIRPDVIHTHLGHADIIGIWSARNLKTKIFCTMHNIYIQKNIYDNFYFLIYRFLLNIIAPNTKVISISKSVEKHVLGRLCLPQSRSSMIYNAIPPNNIEESNKLYKRNNANYKTTLLFVGRLSKQKSVHILLKAIKILKDDGYQDLLNVLLVGDGDLRVPLEALSKELLIDDMVSFVGQTANVEPYFLCSDIFILPSIWEGFGIVILEAFKYKLAVIATNIEGPSELIENEVNGLLAVPNNECELAEKIKLLVNNKSLRDRLAEKGFELFNEKYHIDNYMEELNKLYEKG